MPAVDNEVPDTKVGPLGKIIALLEPELLPASMIDHTALRPAEPRPGVTTEYGKHMSWVCLGLPRRGAVRWHSTRRGGLATGA